MEVYIVIVEFKPNRSDMTVVHVTVFSTKEKAELYKDKQEIYLADLAHCYAIDIDTTIVDSENNVYVT